MRRTYARNTIRNNEEKMKEKTNRVLLREILQDIRGGKQGSDELNKLNRVMASRPAVISVIALIFVFFLILANVIAAVSVGFGSLIRGTPVPLKEMLSLRSVLLPIHLGKCAYPYVMDLLLWILTSVRYVYNIKTSIEPLNIGQKGHARGVYDDEVPKQYRKVPLLHEEYDGRHGYIVREEYNPKDPSEGWAYIDDSTSNLLVLGMTRSGKGECFVFPAIDMFSRVREVQGEKDHMKPSMVITDPKRELYAFSRNTLEKRGYKVFRLDLLEPRRSASYNVLSAATEACLRGDMDETENILRVFVETLYPEEKGTDRNSFFTDLGKQFLLAFLYAHTEDTVNVSLCDKNNMCSVAKNIADLRLRTYTEPGTKTVYTYLDGYFLSRPRLSRARELYADILNQPPETKENILANASRKLSMYSSELIARMTSATSVTGYDLGFSADPIAVFVSMPETNTAYYDIFNAFFNQISYDISMYATLNGGQTLRPVEYIFDEFGNLPAIPRIANNMTICLGKNVRFSFVIQSYTQLNTIYGSDVATTISDNCATELYFLSKNQDTLKHFSEMLGNETITDIHRNGPKLSMNKSYMEQQIEKPLISANELTELAEGECVIRRSIVRKDLKGNDIVPWPIINRGKHRMRYRYDYGLAEDFPNTDIRDVDTQLPNDSVLISGLIYELAPEVEGWIALRREKAKADEQKEVNERNGTIPPESMEKFLYDVRLMLDSMGLTVSEVMKMCPGTDSKSVAELKRKLTLEHPEEAKSAGFELQLLGQLITGNELHLLEEVKL